MTLQEMYQFVFSVMNVPPPFTLHLAFPQGQLILPSMANMPIQSMENTLIFVWCKENEDEIINELENLADPIIIVSICS